MIHLRTVRISLQSSFILYSWQTWATMTHLWPLNFIRFLAKPDQLCPRKLLRSTMCLTMVLLLDRSRPKMLVAESRCSFSLIANDCSTWYQRDQQHLKKERYWTLLLLVKCSKTRTFQKIDLYKANTTMRMVLQKQWARPQLATPYPKVISGSVRSTDSSQQKQVKFLYKGNPEEYTSER